MEPISSWFVSYNGNNSFSSTSYVIVKNDEELDSTQIQQSSYNIHLKNTIEVMKITSDDPTDVVAPELPLPTPTKYNSMGGYIMKFDNNNNTQQDQRLENQCGEDSQQEDGKSDQERDIETIVAGTSNSCHLDEVD